MYYPAFLDLRGLDCVVIGGNEHAVAKANGLLDSGAVVTVIAETIHEGLQWLVRSKKVTWLNREYKDNDLEGAFLVISVLMSSATNTLIRAEAKRRKILINAMDDVPNCNFIAPSILRRGPLTVAISTSGKAPALAVRIRESLAEKIGEEYSQFLEIIGPLRDELVLRFPDFESRRARWYELVDSDILSLLKAGRESEAHERIAEILNVETETVAMEPMP
ncbi:MAG: bifunctional precorrin-2 dehydrogenase/sirohydrochlorin ferrochelatase [Candidatus Latescibacteria bacterium]|nr:bifunctional precorrin-2 dehydrogenase/sirohydrochlorin ferrochelatase [Candidatus Latescibacterota bacterium]